MNPEQTQSKNNLGFSASHISLVILVAVALTGFTYMKNPALFRLRSASVAASEQKNSGKPQYYAYVPPAQSAVLGATTAPDDGPSVLNEDGTISSVSELGPDLGEVLGTNTEAVEINLKKIHVPSVPNSEQAVRGYFAYAGDLESKYLDTGELETALASPDPSNIDSTVKKLQTLISALEKMYAPEDAVQLHKLTIVQYYAALDLLKNFSQLDANPEFVTSKMGEFLSAEEQVSSEQQSLLQKYNL